MVGNSGAKKRRALGYSHPRDIATPNQWIQKDVAEWADDLETEMDDQGGVNLEDSPLPKTKARLAVANTTASVSRGDGSLITVTGPSPRAAEYSPSIKQNKYYQKQPNVSTSQALRQNGPAHHRQLRHTGKLPATESASLVAWVEHNLPAMGDRTGMYALFNDV